LSEKKRRQTENCTKEENHSYNGGEGDAGGTRSSFPRESRSPLKKNGCGGGGRKKAKKTSRENDGSLQKHPVGGGKKTNGGGGSTGAEKKTGLQFKTQRGETKKGPPAKGTPVAGGVSKNHEGKKSSLFTHFQTTPKNYSECLSGKPKTKASRALKKTDNTLTRGQWGKGV